MKRIMFFLSFLFIISTISASCNSTQIDINSASLEELDKLTGIGPVYSQRIIDNRTFQSVDDLIRVKGIGNSTLEKIKAQGLACVQDSLTNNENDIEIPAPKVKEEITLSSKNEPVIPYFPENFTMPKITADSVNSQTIKTMNNEQENSKVNFAVYGLTGFSILLVTLFAIKIFNRRRKNEFRE